MQSKLTEIVTRTAQEMIGGADFFSSCRTAFRDLRPTLQDVGDHLSGATELDRARLFDGSNETTTHYKWLMHREYKPKLTLWLHEYKAPEQRRLGYAEVPHDHRYDFTSLILVGGYLALTWQDGPGELVQADSVRHAAGELIPLGADAIHSLADIDDGTVTLILEGPRRRGFSRAYYPDPPYHREFPDFPERYRGLLGKLGDRHSPGSAPDL